MSDTKSGKHNLWKWIAGILTGVILLLGFAALFFSVRWKPVVADKIKDGINKGSRGLYHIDFKDIHLNLITGTFSLDEVTLTTDTAVFSALKKKGLNPGHIFHLKVNKLQLNRISLLTAYFRKKIDINSIVLDHPSIDVLHYKTGKKKDKPKDEKSLYELLSDTFKSIRVGAIRIVDADLEYINGEDAKPLQSVKHLSVNVKDLLIDEHTQNDSNRFYYTKDIGFQLIGYQSKDKMYVTKVDTVSGSTAEKILQIKGLKMIPQYPDLAFSRMYKYGHDRYDLNFKQILFSGVDFQSLDADDRLHAASLQVGPATTGIFLNREMPGPPNLDKGKNFPHLALRKIPIPVLIDTIKLKNVDVAYTEYNPISQQRGTIYFQNLNGNILNVTNDSLQLLKNNHAVAQVNAMVMKKARIDIKIDFNLTDDQGGFHYSGKIGGLNMVDLNPVSKPLGLIEIESGKMQKTEFDIKANRAGSSGTVNFYYTDLKVKILKEGEDGEAPKKKGFLSFLANNLLIIDSNPEKDKAPRTANINFKRSPGASFFNLLWKGVFVGMRESVGLGIVPMKTPEEGMKKIQEKTKERKEKKEEKKEE